MVISTILRVAMQIDLNFDFQEGDHRGEHAGGQVSETILNVVNEFVSWAEEPHGKDDLPNQIKQLTVHVFGGLYDLDIHFLLDIHLPGTNLIRREKYVHKLRLGTTPKAHEATETLKELVIEGRKINSSAEAV